MICTQFSVSFVYTGRTRGWSATEARDAQHETICCPRARCSWDHHRGHANVGWYGQCCQSLLPPSWTDLCSKSAISCKTCQNLWSLSETLRGTGHPSAEAIFKVHQPKKQTTGLALLAQLIAGKSCWSFVINAVFTMFLSCECDLVCVVLWTDLRAILHSVKLL